MTPSLGKVYLVGAGPGHPGLLTVEARRLLGIADVVVFDRLVQEELLSACRPDTVRVYVGKAPGKHASRQPEINERLVELARQHELVVRLKGGDGFVFGRGGEEAEHLARHGVPFAVIPGVTSALAAPTAAGIPVTHRDHACSFAVVTGHERTDARRDRIDWAALAKVDTLVVLMGVHSVERIAGLLMTGGRSGTTPAALIESAYWASERTVVGTLSTIAEIARTEGIQPPATLVIGEVVRLRDSLSAQVSDLCRSAALQQPTPGPSTSVLERVVTQVRQARVLLAALEVDLFDDLESFTSARALARARGLEEAPMTELCSILTDAGILLREGDGVRNAEVASRYLRRQASGYVGDQLKDQIARSLQFDLPSRPSAPVRTALLVPSTVLPVELF